MTTLKRPYSAIGDDDEPAVKRQRSEEAEEGPLSGLLPELWDEVAAHLPTLDQARGLGRVSKMCRKATIPFRGTEINLPYSVWFRIPEGDLDRRFKPHCYTAFGELPLCSHVRQSVLTWFVKSQTRVVDLAFKCRAPTAEMMHNFLQAVSGRLTRLVVINPNTGYSSPWRTIAMPMLRTLVVVDVDYRLGNIWGPYLESFPTIETLKLHNTGIYLPDTICQLQHLKRLELHSQSLMFPFEGIGPGYPTPCLNIESLIVHGPFVGLTERPGHDSLPLLFPNLRTLDWTNPYASGEPREGHVTFH